MTTAQGVRLVEWLRGPRVWRKDIRRPEMRHAAGAILPVYDRNETLVGWGMWHPHSQIALRILSRKEEEPTTEWLCERAVVAARMRLDDPSIPDSCCRILHAEGDGFPALIVDRYADVLVAEAYTEGALLLFERIRQALHQTLGTKHHRIHYGEKVARAENGESSTDTSADCPTRIQIEEHGIRYELDLTESHKTGFFCDQRENRLRLNRLVESESERLAPAMF